MKPNNGARLGLAGMVLTMYFAITINPEKNGVNRGSTSKHADSRLPGRYVKQIEIYDKWD